MEEFNGHNLIYQDNDTFRNTVATIAELKGIQLTPGELSREDVIFAMAGFFVVGETEIPIIFANQDEMDNLNPDWKQMILVHETAHLEGIIDEEEADRWALNNLNETQQDILKSLWCGRHGHEFYEIGEI